MSNPLQQQAIDWLAERGVRQARLTPLPGGHTNHVFLVEQPDAPQRSVLRQGNPQLDATLCPLAHQPDAVIRRHREVAGLGLAPAVLDADAGQAIMWLAHAGEPRALTPADFPAVRSLLASLHDSGLDWRTGDDPEDDPLRLGYLRQLADGSGRVADVASRLLGRAAVVGAAACPLVPIHSDLNPGNCLHDGERWWLIDWDFAGMKVAGWDYASLIVEQGWPAEQAQLLAPHLSLAELAWLCGNFAFLSWEWHERRGSLAEVRAGKWQAVRYWLSCLA